jgi:hypothetical protein
MSFITTSLSSRPRTTMELSSGFQRHTHSLSFEAHLAIHYATLIATRACRLKVPHAAIVRRAVCRYATYLGELTPEQLHREVMDIRDASKASNGSRGDQEAAWTRLEAIGATSTGGSTQPFKEVLKSKDYSPKMDIAALDATVEAVLASRRRFKPKKGNTPNGTE